MGSKVKLPLKFQKKYLCNYKRRFRSNAINKNTPNKVLE